MIAAVPRTTRRMYMIRKQKVQEAASAAYWCASSTQQYSRVRARVCVCAGNLAHWPRGAKDQSGLHLHLALLVAIAPIYTTHELQGAPSDSVRAAPFFGGGGGFRAVFVIAVLNSPCYETRNAQKAPKKKAIKKNIKIE
jgi:hypothetical protein